MMKTQRELLIYLESIKHVPELNRHAALVFSYVVQDFHHSDIYPTLKNLKILIICTEKYWLFLPCAVNLETATRHSRILYCMHNVFSHARLYSKYFLILIYLQTLIDLYFQTFST